MGFNRKKEMGQRESYDCEPYYVSGKKSNPHAAPNRKTHKYYKDHGAGNHFGEQDTDEKESTRQIW